MVTLNNKLLFFMNQLKMYVRWKVKSRKNVGYNTTDINQSITKNCIKVNKKLWISYRPF